MTAQIDRDTFSYSDIAAYLRCPRSEFYRLSDAEERDNPAMAFGRVLHRLHEYMVTEECTPIDIPDVLEALD